MIGRAPALRGTPSHEGAVNHDAQDLMALALTAAVAVSPVAGSAHEGHGHGKRSKKVKKSKAKQAGIEFAVPRRVA